MIRRAHIHRQALLWSNPNSHVNARCLRAAFTTLARSCTGAKPELAAAALKHLRRFVKPSLVEKRSKRSHRQFSFPLIRKSATSTDLVGFRIFERWRFRRSEKAPPRISKPAELRLCRFSGPLALACCVQDAGKIASGRTCGIRRLRV